MHTIDPSSSQVRHGRALLTAIVIAALVAAGLWLAHRSDVFAPLYHWLGWHEMAQHAESSAAGHSASAQQEGHAGHEGMSMPGMDMEGMDMPAGESSAPAPQASSLPGYATVAITPERQQLIGVRIGKVLRDKLRMSIRAVGIIEPDQRRLARIQTRVNGWVTKLDVDYVGQRVQKGDPLLEIYSPDLVSTQNEYLIARSGPEFQGTDGSPRSLADDSRQRLELYGVAPEEIAELDRTGRARETLLLRSPIEGRVLERNVFEGSYVEPATELYKIADLSVVWLQAKIYEFELTHIEIGQPVEVTLQSEPNKPFQGKVTFVEPVVQEVTRTVKVRVEIDNLQELLKPGMYADLKIEHDMGEGLLIPESAVLRTGERAICFRSLPEGRFEPVEVKLGGRFGDRFEVLSGLNEGDDIVVSAGFLIDSESRLKATTSGEGGHQHGS